MYNPEILRYLLNCYWKYNLWFPTNVQRVNNVSITNWYLLLWKNTFQYCREHKNTFNMLCKMTKLRKKQVYRCTNKTCGVHIRFFSYRCHIGFFCFKYNLFFQFQWCITSYHHSFSKNPSYWKKLIFVLWVSIFFWWSTYK